MALDERRANRSRRWTRHRRESAARITLAVIIVLLAAGVLVIVRGSSNVELISVSRVEAQRDDVQIAITADHGQCMHDPQARVISQTDDTVVVRAEHDMVGDCEDIGLTSVLVAILDAPLGERTITIETSSAGPIECVVDDAPSDRCVAG
jgi:hypothetical protein